MKRWTILLISTIWSASVHADIAVTQGSGKTVATITNNSREFQQVSAQIDGSSNAVSAAQSGTWNVQGSTLMPTGVNASTVAVINGGSTFNATINTALPAGANVIGNVNVNVSTLVPTGVSASTVAVINQTGTSLTVGTHAVSQSGLWTVQIATVMPTGVNASTIAVVNGGTTFNAAVHGSSVTIYAPNGNTTPIPVSGSFSATATSLSTAAITAPIPAVASLTGFTNLSGNMQSGRVNASSDVFVYINNVTSSPVQIQNGAGALTSVGYQTNGGSIPVSVLNVIADSGTLSNNGVAATANRVGTLGGIAQNAYGNNGSAYTQGRDAASMILSTSGLLGVWSGPDITFASYSASTNPFTVSNTTSDISGICGNAQNTVQVYGLRVSCTQTTAGIVPITIAMRSSAYTSANATSFSTITAVAQDSNYVVVKSTAMYFTTAGIGNGTLIAYVDGGQIGCMAAATATPNDIYISPSSWRMKPIVLRGTAQCLGVNFQGASISGGKYTVGYDWMEVTSP